MNRVGYQEENGEDREIAKDEVRGIGKPTLEHVFGYSRISQCTDLVEQLLNAFVLYKCLTLPNNQDAHLASK